MIVAKKICEGRLDHRVRAWATRRIREAGNPKGPKARAKILLDATRSASPAGRWVPDPTDAEFIPSAHLMMERCKGGQIAEDGSCPLGEEAPYLALGDCDDLSVQLGAGIMAPMLALAAAGNVGVYGAVVGHGYDIERNIAHVLFAIWAENAWWYCDPSLPDMPFGTCKPFTRERIIYVPSLEVGCDANVCLGPGGRANGPPPVPARGDYVGISAVPEYDEVPPGAVPFGVRETNVLGLGLGESGRAIIHASKAWHNVTPARAIPWALARKVA